MKCVHYLRSLLRMRIPRRKPLIYSLLVIGIFFGVYHRMSCSVGALCHETSVTLVPAPSSIDVTPKPLSNKAGLNRQRLGNEQLVSMMTTRINSVKPKARLKQRNSEALFTVASPTRVNSTRLGYESLFFLVQNSLRQVDKVITLLSLGFLITKLHCTPSP
jgi:hypothetical protein